MVEEKDPNSNLNLPLLFIYLKHMTWKDVSCQVHYWFHMPREAINETWVKCKKLIGIAHGDSDII